MYARLVSVGNVSMRRNHINIGVYEIRIARNEEKITGKGNNGVTLITRTSGTGKPKWMIRAVNKINNMILTDNEVERAKEIVTDCYNTRFKRD